MTKTKIKETEAPKVAPIKTNEFEGVFVGLIAVGRNKYEPAVINTKGGEVVEVLLPYKSEDGSDIHVALRDWNVLVSKYIRRDPSRLWRNAVDRQIDEEQGD